MEKSPDLKTDFRDLSVNLKYKKEERTPRWTKHLLRPERDREPMLTYNSPGHFIPAILGGTELVENRPYVKNVGAKDGQTKKPKLASVLAKKGHDRDTSALPIGQYVSPSRGQRLKRDIESGNYKSSFRVILNSLEKINNVIQSRIF